MPDDLITRTVLTAIAWVAGALLVGWASGIVVRRLEARTGNRLLGLLRRRCHRPWTVLLVVVALHTAMPEEGPVLAAIRHALLLAVISSAAWLFVRLVYVVEDVALQWLRIDVTDNRRIRRIRTQIGVLRRLTAAVVTVLAVASMLMTFAPLRTLGTSLLASAGVAGALTGLAAQTTLRNVFAGLELAMSDRLRIDDVVVVEGEWGRVEEFALTHVTLRLWDERRLMLPTTYFITTPFQNWTRNESRLLGAVVLHLDYRTPVAELRKEVRRVVERSPLWDGRDWVLQVVDSTPWSMVVRVLASAADAPSSWDLRCDVREHLIAYLRDQHPDALLPRTPTLTGPVLWRPDSGSDQAIGPAGRAGPDGWR